VDDAMSADPDVVAYSPPGQDVGQRFDPLSREPDDDELDARVRQDNQWTRARKDAEAHDRRVRAWRAGLLRPPILLVAGVELCTARPWPQTSPCLRPAGHGGRCVHARRPPGPIVEFYAPAGGEPGLVATTEVRYREPSRVELAETWAWLEEVTPAGDAVR
jgi:hypothetical protein